MVLALPTPPSTNPAVHLRLSTTEDFPAKMFRPTFIFSMNSSRDVTVVLLKYSTKFDRFCTSCCSFYLSVSIVYIIDLK